MSTSHSSTLVRHSFRTHALTNQRICICRDRLSIWNQSCLLCLRIFLRSYRAYSTLITLLSRWFLQMMMRRMTRVSDNLIETRVEFNSLNENVHLRTLRFRIDDCESDSIRDRINSRIVIRIVIHVKNGSR